MTVGELILILQDLPQDADVYKENVQYAYGYTHDETSVSKVDVDEYGFSVTIK